MKRFKLKKLNDKGAALILVMVTVLFITVLASLLLYATGINYEMKTTDYRSKRSFYGAEIPLEQLRVQLAEDVSKATEDAYKHVVVNYNILDNPALREAEFEKVFYENIKKIWTGRGVTDFLDADQWVTVLGTILTDTDYDIYKSTESQDTSKPYHIEVTVKDPVNGILGTTLEDDEVNGRILLCRIKVHYTKDNFLSIISTDYAMDVPNIDWSVENYDNTLPAQPLPSSKPYINFEECVNYLKWEKQ